MQAGSLIRHEGDVKQPAIFAPVGIFTRFSVGVYPCAFYARSGFADASRRCICTIEAERRQNGNLLIHASGFEPDLPVR